MERTPGSGGKGGQAGISEGGRMGVGGGDREWGQIHRPTGVHIRDFSGQGKEWYVGEEGREGGREGERASPG